MKEVGCDQAFHKATYTIEVLPHADYNFFTSLCVAEPW